MIDFRTIQAWHKSRNFVKDVYIISDKFPSREIYGLTSQFRRAAVSINANIAEGCGKNSNKELCRYFQIARGSASECESYVILTYDLEFINEKEFNDLSFKINELQKMIGSYILKVLESNISTLKSHD